MSVNNDTLHEGQNVFSHALCNLLNIYQSDKCFKQKLWGEMKQYFMTFSINVIGFETIQQKGRIAPACLK
jgi:hypothetical protein